MRRVRVPRHFASAWRSATSSDWGRRTAPGRSPIDCLCQSATLTQGKPAFREVVAVVGIAADEVLRLAASLDLGSEHPLAEAIVAEARKRNLELETAEEFESSTGIGVRGRIGTQRLALGNTALMTELGVSVDSLSEAAERLRALGASAMFLAVDGKAAGLVAVADPLKSSTPGAIAALHAAGLRIVMDGRRQDHC